MSDPPTISSKDDEIDSWVKKIKELYGRKRQKQFDEEEHILRVFLKKIKEETEYSKRLSMCKIQGPINIGGSGIIFKATHVNIPEKELILKINRPRLSGDTRSLLEKEMKTLPLFDHPNIIQIIDKGNFEINVDGEIFPLLFIIEPYIAESKELNEYIDSLSKSHLHDADIVSIDNSLQELVSLLHQWTDALVHIHSKEYVYLDVKPKNALVDNNGHLTVIDFGTLQKTNFTDETPVKIYFTNKYAIPKLREDKKQSTSLNRVSISIKKKDIDYYFDYYALGQSIFELLKLISINHPHDYPQRPLFQSILLIATRLLYGLNVEEKSILLGKIPIKETFGSLTKKDYETIHYTNLVDVKRDLKKEYGSWNPENVVPELESYPKKTLRIVPNINTVLTQRLLCLIEHPLIARLKMVNQLGLMTLLYPTATHSRYDHMLGTYTYTTSYVKALYYDKHNCLLRNLVNKNDIKEILLASIIHDLGQYPLAYDLKQVQPQIFDQVSISIALLSDPTKDKKGRTLQDILVDSNKGWEIDVDRLKRILGYESGQLKLSGIDVSDFKADMLSAIIDGPIDAEKADYIIRDSTNCRIPYGQQLDIERLLSVLTTVNLQSQLYTRHRVTIGVYEKGSASASAFSLARYLLFSSVYWHHTARIITSMLQHATAIILPDEVFVDRTSGKISEIKENLIDFIKKLMPPFGMTEEDQIRLQRVNEKISLTEEPPTDVYSELVKSSDELTIKKENKEWYPGLSMTDWQMLNWIISLANSKESIKGVELINLIKQRLLYKRVYTIHRNDDENNQIIMKFNKLEWQDRIKLCKKIQDIVYDIIIERQPNLETTPITKIEELPSIFNHNLVIILDCPNYEELLRNDRPLIFMPELERKTYYDKNIPAFKADNLSSAIASLYKSISPLRVLCHPSIRQNISAAITQKEMFSVLDHALIEVT